MDNELLAIQFDKLAAHGLVGRDACNPPPAGWPVFDDEYGVHTRRRVQLLDPQAGPTGSVPLRDPAPGQPALRLLDATTGIQCALPDPHVMARRMTAYDEYAALEIEFGRLLHVARHRNQPVQLDNARWVVPRIEPQRVAALAAGDAAKAAELDAYQAECVRVWQQVTRVVDDIMANPYVRARVGADHPDSNTANRNAQHHRDALWARVLP